ncbi:MAG: GFA family protein [Cyanobacteria bacterium J06633_23]
MTETTNGSGSCLCSAVSFTTSNFSKKVGACHCGMCRKWGGGPFMEVDCGTDILFKGEENITVYNSSDWAERAFCKKCGSHLFYRLKESNQHMVPVGLFDDQASFVFDTQVFIDKKPSFYSFANQTNDMTAAEIYEMYGP